MTFPDAAPLPEPSARPRISIVDPSTVVRAGLPLMLRSFTFTSCHASCAAALAHRPAADVLMLDPNAGTDERHVTSAVDTVADFVSAGYRVCVYTLDRRPYFLARCRQAGALGVVLKSDPLNVLARCLRQVTRGCPAVSGTVALPVTIAGGRAVALTTRQRQVLAGRARGEPFRRIARRMNISERTAHDHWAAVARSFAAFLNSHSPADLERSLGLDSGPAVLAAGVTLRTTVPFEGAATSNGSECRLVLD